MLNSSITSFKLRMVAPGKLPPLVHPWRADPVFTILLAVADVAPDLVAKVAAQLGIDLNPTPVA